MTVINNRLFKQQLPWHLFIIHRNIIKIKQFCFTWKLTLFYPTFLFSKVSQWIIFNRFIFVYTVGSILFCLPCDAGHETGSEVWQSPGIWREGINGTTSDELHTHLMSTAKTQLYTVKAGGRRLLECLQKIMTAHLINLIL